MNVDQRILALSWALPPSAYPQSIQIGRLLYHCPLPIWAVSDGPGASGGTMDCYPDFTQRMAEHTVVAFRPNLPRAIHSLARKFASLYGRAPDELRPWIKAAEDRIFSQSPKLADDVKLIASFGEPMSDHLLGLRLKRRTGLPWLAHFSDPWFDNPFRKPFVLANAINRRLEQRVLNEADRIVFTSEETRSLVMRKYPDAWQGKADVLPHSFEEGLYPATAKLEPIITVRYLGTFYADRSPLPVLQALAEMHSRSPDSLSGVRFEFIGGVASRILRRARRVPLPEGLVVFKPAVGYSESLRLMKDSDLLLVIDAPADLSVFLPSKLVDYLGAGAPIMGVVPPGSSARLISRTGGSVADPRDRNAIIRCLIECLGKCRRSRRVGSPARPDYHAVRKEYSIENVEEKFVRLLAV